MKYKELSRIQRAQANTSYTPLAYSEAEIINLQRAFSTAGFYSLHVPNKSEGRALVATMLQSLNCHKNVACLSMPGGTETELASTVFNIFYALTLGGYTHGDIDHAFDDFFIDQLECDFLWIEECATLNEQPWYYAFEQRVETFNICREIPVIKLIAP